MSAEVFRFVTIRPPQLTASTEADNVIILERPDSPLVDALRKARLTNSRARVVAVAQGFIASADFINGPRKLDPRFEQLIVALQQLRDKDFATAATNAVKQIFGSLPPVFVNTDLYKKAYAQTTDSLVAAAVERSVPSN